MKKTFEQFINEKFKSFSHGHDWTHEEIDGLYYRKEDYELALEKYAAYEWKLFEQSLRRVGNAASFSKGATK